MFLASVVSPISDLVSEEEGILAAYASALVCRKKSGFTLKMHDFGKASWFHFSLVRVI